jgi:tetratricopeptide (TPR) repeat protein
MPPNSEIEKLERRWKENPKGTVFAPYAEVLRKHGDYPMAKDVLRHGLELHPDHIPGNIVLGRCCLDLGEEGPAEAAFTHVLDLDTENVIALKALADITERQGRLMEAVNWLSRLMTVDPSNDEAREQLTRVDAARNAASATISSAVTVETKPVVAPEKTEPIQVIQPATPASLEEEPGTQIGVGEIGADAEALIDAALGGFDEPLPPMAPPVGHTVPSPSIDDPAVRPLLGSATQPMAELEPAELDLSALASSVEPQSLEGFTPDEPFSSPPAPPPPQTPLTRPSSGASGVFRIGAGAAPEIELRAGGSSEFQAPDDTGELLELSPGRKSEFQDADPSEELRISTGAGSEYQSPSGADDLLTSSEAPPARPDFLDPLPTPFGSVVTSGFAAMSVMPTEEMPSSGLGQPPTEKQVPALSPSGAEPPEQGLVEMLEAATSDGSPTEAAAKGTDTAGSPRTSEIRFIFPEDAEEPEQPKIRRISEETGAGAEPEIVETPVGEPQPVVTETMAELYARQGHMAEALNVYRVLAEQQPNDGRIAQRIREIEVTQAAGSRRLSYVAMDTGGESVESFFRSLSDARPKGGSTTAPEQDARAAPTRPTNDPLSLSAIFGEEPTAASAATREPPGPGAPDSFSFDQFFGGAGASPPNPGPRPSMPSDEDLDQFQNWLKSLKR